MTEAESRVILHCDCNNFFASVELLEHPELRDRPVAVCGDPESRHGIILAKNGIAKAAGVQTAETLWQARQKCPGLVLLPAHHHKYSEMSRRVNRIYLSVTDQVEPFSVDESWLDVTGSRQLFGGGVRIADELRRRVREELGITISVGVSFNKVWAKMGSDYKKPDATTRIGRDNVADILYPLPVTDFLFVGAAAGEVLGRHGIGTVGELAACPPELLTRWLGRMGEGLWRDANGYDTSPVRRWGERDPVKSVGNSITFPRDLKGRDECREGLMTLADSVGTRLRAHGLRARTITVQVKDPALRVTSHRHTLATPTALTRTIYREACAILEEFWPAESPVRLLGVTAENLCPEGEDYSAQLSLLDEVRPDDPRQMKLEQTIDHLRSRYGRDAVKQRIKNEGK